MQHAGDNKVIAVPGVKILAFACSQHVLMYSPDGTNIYDSKGGKFEGIGSV